MVEIFGTLGPACSEVEVLKQMFAEGMTGMRLNMSHSGLRDSADIIENYHKAATEMGVKADLLIDMQGPEIRIGVIEEPFEIAVDETVELVDIQSDCEPDCASIPTPSIVFPVLEAGDHMLIDDGKLELLIESVEKDRAVGCVLRGGLVQSRKSLKVVGKYIPGPAITEHDRENIRLIREYGVTSLMQPFVTRGEELIEVREELHKNGLDDIRLFAKIENREGMKQLREIIPHVDMLVIARGDLGNDMPLWELPAAQKEISDICKECGKSFLVVTQMLQSMIASPVPTRAEVSDIFHAVLSGADAVMVTGETAVGKYPVEVIKYLKKTADSAEYCDK